jgi:hypothetical protein
VRFSSKKYASVSPSAISTWDRVGGVPTASSEGRLLSSVAAVLLPTPASAATGMNRPATRTPDRTLTMVNINIE